MKSINKIKGFTAVEVVLVIAVVGTFIAVLLTLWTKAPAPAPTKPLGESDRLAYVQEFNVYSASSTNSKVAVGNTSTLLLATSTTGMRKYARFTNLGATTVYLSVGTAAVDQMGIALFASSTYEIQADRNPFLQAIYAISSTSPTNVSVINKI